ncbi:MAG: ATP-binding protein [Geodermatophilaceae bacterium]
MTVRVEGRPVALSREQEQSLFRIASECLFNTAQHAHASRAIIRLSYTGDWLRLSVADDGDGDPEVLRRLATSNLAARNGYHRGLANMITRAAELQGTLQFRRARIGGIRVEIAIPRPAAETECEPRPAAAGASSA